MNSEWKCFIRQDDICFHTNLFIVRETGYGVGYLHIGEKGEILFSEGKRFEPIKPLLTLNDMMAKDLFQAISVALDKQGFKPESNAKLEGELIATKSHLQDLRQLLKLK